MALNGLSNNIFVTAAQTGKPVQKAGSLFSCLSPILSLSASQDVNFCWHPFPESHLSFSTVSRQTFSMLERLTMNTNYPFLHEKYRVGLYPISIHFPALHRLLFDLHGRFIKTVEINTKNSGYILLMGY